MAGPIAIGLTGIFLILIGMREIKSDIKKYHTIENFDLSILIFSIILPIISIIVGLLFTLLFLYIIKH